LTLHICAAIATYKRLLPLLAAAGAHLPECRYDVWLCYLQVIISSKLTISGRWKKIAGWQVCAISQYRSAATAVAPWAALHRYMQATYAATLTFSNSVSKQ
jgi:hypothetical protein